MSRVIPRIKTRFIRVKCPDCGNEQIIFEATTSKVKCNICSAMLAEPKGGKAKIIGEIVEALE